MSSGPGTGTWTWGPGPWWHGSIEIHPSYDPPFASWPKAVDGANVAHLREIPKTWKSGKMCFALYGTQEALRGCQILPRSHGVWERLTEVVCDFKIWDLSGFVRGLGQSAITKLIVWTVGSYQVFRGTSHAYIYMCVYIYIYIIGIYTRRAKGKG